MGLLQKEGQPNLYQSSLKREDRGWWPLGQNQQRKRPPPTPFEKAVMSRRPAIELSDNEDDFPEQDWETEGSGLMNASADKLINQLYVHLGSIKAGNNSIKLQPEVIYLLDSLVENGLISEKEKKKLLVII